jgi:hypothetical protein
VIVGIRVWSNSLSGKFENATEMIDSAGSKKPPPVNVSEAAVEHGGAGEEGDVRGGRTETTSAEHSGGGRSGGAKRGGSELEIYDLPGG